MDEVKLNHGKIYSKLVPKAEMIAFPWFVVRIKKRRRVNMIGTFNLLWSINELTRFWKFSRFKSWSVIKYDERNWLIELFTVWIDILHNPVRNCKCAEIKRR